MDTESALALATVASNGIIVAMAQDSWRGLRDKIVKVLRQGAAPMSDANNEELVGELDLVDSEVARSVRDPQTLETYRLTVVDAILRALEHETLSSAQLSQLADDASSHDGQVSVRIVADGNAQVASQGTGLQQNTFNPR